MGLVPVYCKRGFTLIEVIVSGTILVVAMALIAVFFVKAQKLRSAITKENNTQVIANSQMMNAVMFGIGPQQSDGLMYAKTIMGVDTNPTSRWIDFASPSVPPVSTDNYVRLEISTGTSPGDFTLWQKTEPYLSGYLPSGWTISKDLDQNDKIGLVENPPSYDSYFKYYDVSGNPTTNFLKISQVEIHLSVQDKNLPNSLPFILTNTVTLKNIPQID